MKVTIQKQEIEIIINNFQPFCKKDLTSPSSHIYMEATDGILMLRVNDFELGISASINDVTIEEEGIITFNAKKMSDILRRMKNKEINFIANNASLTITQDKSKFELESFNIDEYPSFPTYTDLKEININCENFLSSLKKIMPAIDNGKKIEFNGAYLDLKDSLLNFVATDSRRLAIISEPIQTIETLDLIIPKRAIVELLRLFHSGFHLYNDGVTLFVKSDEYIFYTKLIKGNFPDYSRIIPPEFKYELPIPKNDIIEAIKTINAISSKARIKILDSEVVIEAISDDSSNAITAFDYASGIGNNIIEFGIEIRHLLDFLANIDKGEFTLCFNQPQTPIVFKSDNFITISMPLN